MSFIIVWRTNMPALFLHERPCPAEASTGSPQRQTCGSYKLTPSRIVSEIRSWTLDNLRPNELDGSAVNQADCILPSKDFRQSCVFHQSLQSGDHGTASCTRDLTTISENDLGLASPDWTTGAIVGQSVIYRSLTLSNTRNLILG